MSEEFCAAFVNREQEFPVTRLNFNRNNLASEPASGWQDGHDFRREIFAGLSRNSTG